MWPVGATNAEILTLVEECSRQGAVVFTDGPVRAGVKSDWAYSARQNGVVLAESSGAFAQTTSNMSMEVRATYEAIVWLRYERHVHAIFVIDSLSTLEKVGLGMHWKPSITESQLGSIVWIFSPGHAGVLGTERADVLAWSSEIRGTLIMDHPAVRTAVQEMMTATMTEVSFTIDLLKEKKVTRGDWRHGTLHGPAKRRANQMLMEIVSIHILRWTLQRRGESLWMTSDDDKDP